MDHVHVSEINPMFIWGFGEAYLVYNAIINVNYCSLIFLWANDSSGRRIQEGMRGLKPPPPPPPPRPGITDLKEISGLNFIYFFCVFNMLYRPSTISQSHRAYILCSGYRECEINNSVIWFDLGLCIYGDWMESVVYFYRKCWLFNASLRISKC